jgi:hypothetical protein
MRGCPSGSTFFGLTPEYKKSVHENIFVLAYFTKGGFTFDQVYFMPVYLRNFYLKQLQDMKQKEADAHKDAAKPKSRKR